MIKAAIWDFGGVVTTSPFRAFEKYEQERKLPKNFIRMVNARDPDSNAWAKLERSEIDRKEFDERFAAETRAAGFEVRGYDVLKLLTGQVRPEMVFALRRLKPLMKLGCITNNIPLDPSDAIVNRDVQEALALFDPVIESAKIGLRKPDPKIYRLMLECLELAPEHCVYLDDLGINLKPARAMGMATIKVEDPWRALEELELLTQTSLRPPNINPHRF